MNCQVPESSQLRIEKLVAGGRGLARSGGRVWLVSGALPGELVRATPHRVAARHVQASVVRIIEPSPERLDPPCPLQTRCGGCDWMPLSESGQRRWKRRLVEEALRRIGRLEGIAVAPTVASPDHLAYRNKLEFSFGIAGGRSLGFHARARPAELVDVDRCLLQGEPANRVLAVAREFFLAGPGARDPAVWKPAEPLRLVIRSSSHTGRMLVALRGPPGRFATAGAFARRARREVSEVAGVVRLLASPGRRGGVRTLRLAGCTWLQERLAGLLFRLPAGSFFQVNTAAAERIVALVTEAAAVEADMPVLEIYGGVGVYGLSLARAGARVTIGDADAAALRCGRAAASRNSIARVGFVHADALRLLQQVRERPHVVIANPPRTGLGPGVARAVARLAPQRIVLVSCDPATLARDARALIDAGYAIRRVTPIDMFPQTHHVETVTELDRSGSDG